MTEFDKMFLRGEIEFDGVKRKFEIRIAKDGPISKDHTDLLVEALKRSFHRQLDKGNWD